MNTTSGSDYSAVTSSNAAMLAPFLRALPSGLDWPAIDAYNALWRSPAPGLNRAGRPIRFVAQEKALHALDYEQRIYETGIVATRERNWHDLFNALIWTTFPRAKAAINARHYDESQRSADSSNQRTRVRDALTLLDESGVIVASDAPDLLDLLRAMKWKELFWQRRREVGARMRFILFGHGLCEQTLRPYIGLTGKALLLAVDASVLAAEETEQIGLLDAQTAAWCEQPGIAPSALHPLPLLGVPGWWAANENESFYENRAYFRSQRSRLEPASSLRNLAP